MSRANSVEPITEEQLAELKKVLHTHQTTEAGFYRINDATISPNNDTIINFNTQGDARVVCVLPDGFLGAIDSTPYKLHGGKTAIYLYQPIHKLGDELIPGGGSIRALKITTDYKNATEEEFIQQVYDTHGAFFFEDSIKVIDMPFLGDCNLTLLLDDMLARPQKYSFEFRWTLINKLTNAVSQLHESGIVHRDLSPSNIRINLENLDVYVVDFDRSIDLNSAHNPEKLLGGTLGYGALEFKEHNLGGTHSDVFSLIILIFEILGDSTARIEWSKLYESKYPSTSEWDNSYYMIEQRNLQLNDNLNPSHVLYALRSGLQSNAANRLSVHELKEKISEWEPESVDIPRVDLSELQANDQQRREEHRHQQRCLKKLQRKREERQQRMEQEQRKELKDQQANKAALFQEQSSSDTSPSGENKSGDIANETERDPYVQYRSGIFDAHFENFKDPETRDFEVFQNSPPKEEGPPRCFVM